MYVLAAHRRGRPSLARASATGIPAAIPRSSAPAVMPRVSGTARMSCATLSRTSVKSNMASGALQRPIGAMLGVFEHQRRQQRQRKIDAGRRDIDRERLAGSAGGHGGLPHELIEPDNGYQRRLLDEDDP